MNDVVIVRGLDGLVGSLLQQDPKNRELFLTSFLQAAVASDHIEAMKSVARVRKQEADVAKASVVPLPLTEPKWMTIYEVEGLGLGYSRASIVKRIGELGLQSRVRSNRQHEYQLRPEDLHHFDKEGRLGLSESSRKAHEAAMTKYAEITAVLRQKGVHTLDSQVATLQEKYTHLEAAAHLRELHVSYNLRMIRMMIHRGHLLGDGEIVYGISLAQHVDYMSRRMFLSDVDRPLMGWLRDKINEMRTKPFTVEDVALQLTRSGDIIGVDADNPAHVLVTVPKDREEIAASLSSGVWLTAEEVVAYGSPLQRTKIAETLKDGQLLGRKQIGKATYGLITPTTALLIGLDANKLGMREVEEVAYSNLPEISSKLFRVETPFKRMIVDPCKNYEQPAFECLFEGSNLPKHEVEELWRHYKNVDGKITGSKLISVAHLAADALFLGGDTYRFISLVAGVNAGDVEQILRDGKDVTVNHLFKNRLPYIRKSELGGVAAKIAESIYGLGWKNIVAIDLAPHIPDAADISTEIKRRDATIASLTEDNRRLNLNAEATREETQSTSRKMVQYETDAVTAAATIEQLKQDLAASQRSLAERIEQSRSVDAMAAKATRREFSVHGTPLELYAGITYTKQQVGDVLKRIHPDVFAGHSIDTAIASMEREGDAVRGASFIAFVEQVNGLLLLSSSSSMKKIATKLGVSTEEAAELLENGSGKKYRRSLPGIVRGEYVLASDLEELTQLTVVPMHTAVTRIESPAPVPKTKPEDPNALIVHYHGNMRTNKIMPATSVYEKLMNAGVFDQSSAEKIRQTYEEYIGAMTGWVTYDFNRVRDKMGLPWPAFLDGPMKMLVDEGFAKDILRELRPFSRAGNVYVLKEGTEPEVLKRLNVKS